MEMRHEKSRDIDAECCGDNFGGGDYSDRIQELLDNKHTITTTTTTTITTHTSYVHDDAHDDCVMLDGDPDKPALQIHHEPHELLLVGAKGQVACRDYPHPRHLCANFPFTSTPHAMHCDQCHCYVCDSLAPCLHWSAGGHCDATDKLEFWKHQRRGLKKISTPLTHPVQNQINQVLGSTSFEPVFFPESRAARLASALSRCSKATDLDLRKIPNQSRNRRIGCDLPRNTLGPNLILHHLRNTGGNFKECPKSGTYLKDIASPLVEKMLNRNKGAAAAQGTVGGNTCLGNRVSDQKVM